MGIGRSDGGAGFLRGEGAQTQSIRQVGFQTTQTAFFEAL